VNTLRAKIAILLVVAIVSVVGLLTVMLFYVLGPPKRVHSLDPVARQVETLARVVRTVRTSFHWLQSLRQDSSTRVSRRGSKTRLPRAGSISP